MTAPPHDAFFKAAFEHPEHTGALVRHMLSKLVASPMIQLSAIFGESA